MYALGFTLNTMTLMGLSLAVGILVDDSIVVLENIYRHLAMGETPEEAAIHGRSEIGTAAVAITLVDVVVFMPVAFMGGIVGQFFPLPSGSGIAVATLFSLLMSFTLATMLAARWYKQGENTEATTGFFGAINCFMSGWSIAIGARWAGRCGTAARLSLSATWRWCWLSCGWRRRVRARAWFPSPLGSAYSCLSGPPSSPP